MRYVTLLWSEYHYLNQYAQSPISETAEAAEAHRYNYIDEVVGPLSADDALRLSRAFSALAYANWHPNQTQDEQDRNAQVAASSETIIAQCRLAAERM